MYITKKLYNVGVMYVVRKSGCNLCSACRPDATCDSGTARGWRGIRDGTGRAVRDEPAGHFQAFESSGACWTDLARTRCAASALPGGDKSPYGSDRLAGELSQHVGKRLPAP